MVTIENVLHQKHPAKIGFLEIPQYRRLVNWHVKKWMLLMSLNNLYLIADDSKLYVCINTNVHLRVFVYKQYDNMSSSNYKKSIQDIYIDR